MELPETRGRIRLMPGRMDVNCMCWRRPCKHERAEEARYLRAKTWADQINSLTDDDVEWLRSVGWRM
jgi:hypothetical protein